jgi:glycosyltransferase involved in cell wall biosynthesis
VADKSVREEGLHFYPVDIKRSMGPLGDLKFLIRIFLFLRREKFDIVETATAKAGMIGMIAAWLARVPIRVYTLHGAWYEQWKGFKRKIAALTVFVPCALAHRVFVISREIMEMDIHEHILNPAKASLINQGSCNGVDTERFSRNKKTIAAGKRIRDFWQIPQDAFVMGFIGRASIDKGIRELAEAFKRLHSIYGNKLYLIMVGIFDYMGGMLPQDVIQYLKGHSNIKCVGAVDDVENYYAAMDLVVLPTYREGLPSVLLEAAATGVPVVATDIYGCRASMADGLTGILVEPRNVDALHEGIVKLIENEPLRKQMAENAPNWVKERFDCHKVWQWLLKEYLQLYQKKFLS